MAIHTYILLGVKSQFSRSLSTSINNKKQPMNVSLVCKADKYVPYNHHNGKSPGGRVLHGRADAVREIPRHKCMSQANIEPVCYYPDDTQTMTLTYTRYKIP